ncbi:hypothetical protein ACKVMT_17540 [Halobacteriales archaeon Cl-PHB]
MHTEADALVIDGEVLVAGTSLFVEPSGEVAWLTSLEGNYVRVETVDEALKIPLERFRTRVVDGDYVPGARPQGHPAIPD